MEILHLNHFTIVVADLQRHISSCHESVESGHPPHPDVSQLKSIEKVFKQAHELAVEMGWTEVAHDINIMNTALPDYTEYLSLLPHLTNCFNRIISQAFRQKVVLLDQKFSNYTNNPSPFGDHVERAFPSATSDIVEATNCLAIGFSTAAVFHLMRSVEWSLRAFCHHLGIHRIPTTRKPGKKKKYAPIEYSVWEKILEEAHSRVDAKIDKIRRGRIKQDAQQFYYPLLREYKGFKDAWRNHCMHTRAEYSPKDAERVYDHVRIFMESLATKISEV